MRFVYGGSPRYHVQSILLALFSSACGWVSTIVCLELFGWDTIVYAACGVCTACIIALRTVWQAGPLPPGGRQVYGSRSSGGAIWTGERAMSDGCNCTCFAC